MLNIKTERKKDAAVDKDYLAMLLEREIEEDRQLALKRGKYYEKSLVSHHRKSSVGVPLRLKDLKPDDEVSRNFNG